MTRSLKSISLVAAILCAMLLTSCSSGSSSGAGSTSGNNASGTQTGATDTSTPPPAPDPTTPPVVTEPSTPGGLPQTGAASSPTATIGPAGGTITVTDPTSPLNGATLYVPAGALTQNVTITMKPSPDAFARGLLAHEALVIEFDPKGATFSSPLSLTIPYSDSNALEESRVKAMLFDETSRAWKEAPTENANPGQNTVTARIDNLRDKYSWGEQSQGLSATLYKRANAKLTSAVTLTSPLSQTPTNLALKALGMDNVGQMLAAAPLEVDFFYSASLMELDAQGEEATVAHSWTLYDITNATGGYSIEARAKGSDAAVLSGLITETQAQQWLAGAPLLHEFDYSPVQGKRYGLSVMLYVAGQGAAQGLPAGDASELGSGNTVIMSYKSLPTATFESAAQVDTNDNRLANPFDVAVTVPITPAPDTTAPSMPTWIQVTAISDMETVVRWEESTDNVGVVEYKLYRDGFYYKTVGRNFHTDTGLRLMTKYCYNAQAVDAAGNLSRISPQACATTLEQPDTLAPTAPSDLMLKNTFPTPNPIVNSTASKITLVWDPSEDNVGVTKYRVYRNNDILGTVTQPQYCDANTACATSYCYTVMALDAAGNESLRSNELCVSAEGWLDTLIPSAPTSFTASSVNSNQINLAWGGSSDNCKFLGYTISRYDYVNGEYISDHYLNVFTTTGFADHDVEPGVTYCYHVRSMDWKGLVSQWIGPLCLTTDNAPVCNIKFDFEGKQMLSQGCRL